MAPNALQKLVERPAMRRLRIYAIDPLVSPYENPVVTVEVPWEDLSAGPRGRLVEVIDYDASAKTFYSPVDLEDPYVIARNGLDPSESDPRFHQQMVYAVVMATQQRFEHALGRYVALHGLNRKKGVVQPLKIFPHGLREANAFFNPAAGGIVCGYFHASRTEFGRNLPGGVVFTCLSHDVVAHETTHGILHGLRPFFLEPTGPDVLAFHEAFADIVAILQRFSLPGFLERAIRASHAELDSADPLFEMGRQFGEAIGQRGALRSALRKDPDPTALANTLECHDRGAILLAAVFRALIAIYKRRTRDLLRIATGGTGILPEGELAPDLVARLEKEARKTASHLLEICIRAVDYCPPVDITFGDFLRALVTADRDLVPDDPWGYRVALIDAFRSWGIYPEDVVSLAEDSLAWEPPKAKLSLGNLKLDDLRFDRSPHDAPTPKDRARYYKYFNTFATRTNKPAALSLSPDHPVQIHSVRPLRRIAPNGRIVNEVVVQAVQQDKGDLAARSGLPTHRGGCTLIVSEQGVVRYCIYKRLTGATRLERQRLHLADLATSHRGDQQLKSQIKHDFRILHRGW